MPLPQRKLYGDSIRSRGFFTKDESTALEVCLNNNCEVFIDSDLKGPCEFGSGTVSTMARLGNRF